MSKTKWYNPSNWGYEYWNKKTYGEFQTEMSGTTAVFGRDKKIEVTFNGDTAFANENVINFPSLDISTEMGDDTLTLCRGFVDHHSSKIRFSDRNLANQVQKTNEKDVPLLWSLFDAIESVRTESAYTATYPGAIKNLAELADEQARTFDKKNDIGFFQKVPLPTIAPIAISSAARKANGYFGFGLSDIQTHIHADDKEQVAEWAERVNECKDTKESLDLAKEIYEILKKEDDEQRKENKAKGNGEVDLMPGFGQIVKVKVEKCKMDEKDDIPPYKPYTYKYDRVHHWSDPKVPSEIFEMTVELYHYYAGQVMKKQGNVQKYMQRMERLGPTINVMRRKLELMIAAQRRIEWDYIKERGKFDSKRMCAVMAGDQNVFKTKENAAEIDTAISVAVDMSGSMNGEKRRIACDTAIVLFECLSKIGIPFELVGFDSSHSYPTEADHREVKRASHDKDNSGKCARYDALHTYVFKGFRDRAFDARPYIMGLDNTPVAGHNNCDGESVELIHRRLAARPEKRKIMFVLSDGCPATDAYTGHQLARHLKKVVQDIERKGTDIVGIGIEDKNVKHFYTKNVVIQRAEELSGTMLKLLEDALVKKRGKK